jgi:hypothetical protein
MTLIDEDKMLRKRHKTKEHTSQSFDDKKDQVPRGVEKLLCVDCI